MGGSYAGGNFTHVDLNWVIAGFGVADDAGESLARARLAACAPEMARLLLSIEWDGVLGCPVCSSYPPLTGTAGHKQGCALAAVLRKAGVKE
jgi:hypothetical protein